MANRLVHAYEGLGVGALFFAATLGGMACGLHQAAETANESYNYTLAQEYASDLQTPKLAAEIALGVSVGAFGGSIALRRIKPTQ